MGIYALAYGEKTLTCGSKSRMKLRQRSAHPMKSPFWPSLVTVQKDGPITAVLAPQSSCVHSTFSMLIARTGHIRATSSTTHTLSACIVLFAPYMARKSFPDEADPVPQGLLDHTVGMPTANLQSHTLQSWMVSCQRSLLPLADALYAPGTIAALPDQVVGWGPQSAPSLVTTMQLPLLVRDNGPSQLSQLQL
jgi:hypothetical protein